MVRNMLQCVQKERLLDRETFFTVDIFFARYVSSDTWD
jgi:hypothetical protein